MPGDANEDTRVDVSDLGILAANYGTRTEANWGRGDFNEDGAVDVSDLGILAANYGTGIGSDQYATAAAEAVIDTAAAGPLNAVGGCGSVGIVLSAVIGLAFGCFTRSE
jgi:hypothetical protein